MRVPLLLLMAAVTVLAIPGASGAKAAASDEDMKICQGDGETGVVIAACTRFIDAGSLDPDDMAAARLSRASAYMLSGDCTRAIPDLGESLNLDPGQFYAYALRGLCRYRSKQYDLAVSDYTKALALRPDADVLNRRAAAYEAEGDHAHAEADKAAAAKLTPAG